MIRDENNPERIDESSTRLEPVLPAPARALLEEGLHICMHGEYAPGGTENWSDWARKTEQYLRALSRSRSQLRRMQTQTVAEAFEED